MNSKKIITPQNISNHNIDVTRLGRKAFNAIALKGTADRLGYKTPSFSIIPAEEIEINWPILLADLTYDCNACAPFFLLESNLEKLAAIFAQNRDLFTRAFDVHEADAKFPVLRTSLVTELDGELSFAGINCTAYPDSVENKDAFIRASVAEGYAGLFKPFTNWYLDRHGFSNQQRPATIGFFSFLDTTTQGTLVVDGTGYFINHVDRNGNKSILLPEYLQDTNTTEHEPLKDLYNRCACLKREVGATYEVEYRLSDNGELYLTQVRKTEDRHTNNTVPSGNLIDLSLVDKSVDPTTIIELLKNPDNTFMVGHLDPRSIDAFYLLSIAQHKLGIKDLSLHIQKRKGREFDHFITVLNEDPYLRSLTYSPAL